MKRTSIEVITKVSVEITMQDLLDLITFIDESPLLVEYECKKFVEWLNENNEYSKLKNLFLNLQFSSLQEEIIKGFKLMFKFDNIYNYGYYNHNKDVYCCTFSNNGSDL